MKALVLIEHDEQTLAPTTLSAIAAAQQLSDEVDLFVMGHQCQGVAEAARQIPGIANVFCALAEHYQNPLAETTAALLVKFLTEHGSEYHYLLAAATTFGKNALPRVAALLDVAQISDIVEVVNQETFVRPIYAGSLLATVQSSDPFKVITVRPTAFPPVAISGGEARLQPLEPLASPANVAFVERKLNVSERPDLATAEVVVTGGRALGSGENFALLEQLAAKLQGAVGATRAAVDAGYVPNDYQVGQTGKIVAPKLYIAIGVSGAIQHLAGMKESQVIVAINKDEEAPIFQVADYGLVADLFEAVPALIQALD